MARAGGSSRLPLLVLLLGIAALSLISTESEKISNRSSGNIAASPQKGGGNILRKLGPKVAEAHDSAAAAHNDGHGDVVEGGDAGHGEAAGGEHGGGGGGHDTHGGIFNSAVHQHSGRVGWMMMFTIIMQMVLDMGIRFLETNIGPSSKLLLANIYKELTTLGLISFILFIITSFPPATMDSLSFHAFEYAHVLIFALAIFYIFQSAIMIGRIKPIKHQLIKLNKWDNNYLATSSSTQALSTSVTTSPSSSKSSSKDVKAEKKEDGYIKGYGFAYFREKFIQTRRLPPSFLYDRYLTQLYQGYVTLKLEVAAWVWMVVIALFGIHIIVAKYPTIAEFVLNPFVFLSYGWMLLACDLCLYLLVGRAHQRVLSRLQKELVLDHLGRSQTVVNNDGFDLDGDYSEGHNVLEEIKRRRTELVTAFHEHKSRKEMNIERAHSIIMPLNKQNSLTKIMTPSSATPRGVANGSSIARMHSRDSLSTETGSHGSASGHSSLRSSISIITSSTSSSHHHHHPGLNILHHHQTEESLQDNSDATEKDAHYYGFRPWETKAFDAGSQLLPLLRSLYLAAFVVGYIYSDFENYSVGIACLHLLLTPIPALLTAVIIAPNMITRYLLVKSMSGVNLRAIDSVVEYMECAQEAFSNIGSLLQDLIANDDGEANEENSIHQDGEVEHKKKSVEEIFTSFNGNKTGEISYNELRLGLHKMGVGLRPKYFRALLRFVDVEQTGRVNLEDFKVFLKGGSIFNVGGEEDESEQLNLVLAASKSRQLRRFMSYDDSANGIFEGDENEEDEEEEEGSLDDDELTVSAVVVGAEK